MFSKVAIIVPAYISSEKNTIERTLNYLLEHVNGINRDNLYLCWNGKDPGVIPKIKSLANTIEVIGSSSKAENLNFCINLLPSIYEYIIIYDADARPSKDSVVNLLNCIESKPKYAYIQGRFNFTRGHNIFTRLYDEMENILNNIIIPGSTRTYNFNGHDAIIRLEALRSVRGFDPGQLLEDADISYRLKEAGWKSGYLHKHESAAESCPTVKSFIRQRHRWYAGRFALSPLVVIIRAILALFWIIAYFIWKWKAVIITYIIGLFLLGFHPGLALVFVIYPFVILFLTIYYLIHGSPKKFRCTPRNPMIAGRKLHNIYTGYGKSCLYKSYFGFNT